MRLASLSLPLFGLISTTLASCGHGIDFIFPQDAKNLHGRESFKPPKWSYGTKTGPLLWHTLDPAWGVCANGTNQSPILIANTDYPWASIKVDLPTQRHVEFENLLTTVEVVAKGTLWSDGTEWKLAQFHFHTPSEHRLEFAHYPAEVHFVWKAADGSPRLSVTGFFIDISGWDGTPFLENIFGHLHEIREPGETTHIPILDFYNFRQIINEASYYRYSGSLTTPPCTQGVNWYVGNKVLQIKVDTYHKLRSITKTNNRYSQNRSGETNLLQPQLQAQCKRN